MDRSRDQADVASDDRSLKYQARKKLARGTEMKASEAVSRLVGLSDFVQGLVPLLLNSAKSQLKSRQLNRAHG